jgi:hypothetical protein
MISRQLGSHKVVDGSSTTSSNGGARGNRDNISQGIINSEKGLQYNESARMMGVPVGQTFPPQRITANPFTMSQFLNLDGSWGGSNNNSNNTNKNNLLSVMNLLGDSPTQLSMLLDAHQSGGTLTHTASPPISSTMGKRLIDDSTSRLLLGTKMSSLIGGSPPSKKQKTAFGLNNNDSTINGRNPVLMHRLSSLSGGFPMPKFNGTGQIFGRKDSNDINTSFLSSRQHHLHHQQQQQQQRVFPSTMIGAFPMPPLKVKRSLEQLVPPLDAYRQLWDEQSVRVDDDSSSNNSKNNMMGTDVSSSYDATTISSTRKYNLELQRESFSRRLHAGTVRIEGKTNKMLCLQ